MKNRWKQIRDNCIKRKQGAAMIMVLCVMTVFIALSFSILLVASVAYTSSMNSMTTEKCKVLAVSMSDMITKEIEGANKDTNSLRYYLYDQIYTKKSWTYYDENLDFHDNISSPSISRSFSFSGTSDVPPGYTLELSMYWSRPDGGSQEDMSDYSGSTLYTTITCAGAGGSYKVQSNYQLTAEKNQLKSWRWDLSWRK